MSAIGWPGPMGSSPGGGSGCISGMTGLTDSSGGDVMLRLAQRHRGPHGDSVALRQLDVDQADPRPRLRTVVTTRIGPGSGAHKKFPDTAIGCDVSVPCVPCASRGGPTRVGPVLDARGVRTQRQHRPAVHLLADGPMLVQHTVIHAVAGTGQCHRVAEQG